METQPAWPIAVDGTGRLTVFEAVFPQTRADIFWATYDWFTSSAYTQPHTLYGSLCKQVRFLSRCQIRKPHTLYGDTVTLLAAHCMPFGQTLLTHVHTNGGVMQEVEME